MKQLCLNMIVKNEALNIERCLRSVADHISCWVIGDTGSTDGTQSIIQAFFATRKIPGELHGINFHNFEEARNAALDAAHSSTLQYDYLLFCDADMELVVEDKNFRNFLTASSYQVRQRSGSISYWNTRILNKRVNARYRGVTHEYLEVPDFPQKLRGLYYNDYATGANRINKFDRDIRLLTASLADDPSSSRNVFYLAQSLRDAGFISQAASVYAKCAEMGGWDEEVWYAGWQRARCLHQLGDEKGFLAAALTAFNRRPFRAEPLYDLSRFYRECGMHDISLIYSKFGLSITRPDDNLFVDDFIHYYGIKEEYSISAYYSP